jgi:hypothetical protein
MRSILGLPQGGVHAQGVVTNATVVGVPLRLIMGMGRWMSNTVRLYTYCSAHQLWGCASDLMESQHAGEGVCCVVLGGDAGPGRTQAGRWGEWPGVRHRSRRAYVSIGTA